jgi:hypothetical protein
MAFCCGCFCIFDIDFRESHGGVLVVAPGNRLLPLFLAISEEMLTGSTTRT